MSLVLNSLQPAEHWSNWQESAMSWTLEIIPAERVIFFWNNGRLPLARWQARGIMILPFWRESVTAAPQEWAEGRPPMRKLSKLPAYTFPSFGVSWTNRTYMQETSAAVTAALVYIGFSLWIHCKGLIQCFGSIEEKSILRFWTEKAASREAHVPRWSFRIMSAIVTALLP